MTAVMEWILIVLAFNGPTSADSVIVKRFATYEACAAATRVPENCIMVPKDDRHQQGKAP